MADAIYEQKKGELEKPLKYNYVKVVNPFVLGMQIAIGMFIMLPLLVLAILFITVLLGISI